MIKPKEVNYPADYDKAFIDDFINKLDSGSCATIISPSGFGKSNLLRYLGYNQHAIKRFQNEKNVSFIYTDLNLLFEKTPENLLEFILLNILIYFAENDVITFEERKEFVQRINDDSHLQLQLLVLSEILEKKKGNGVLYIILDSLDDLLEPEYVKALNLIKFLRDRFGSDIQFLFSLADLKKIQQIREGLMGTINQIFFQHVHYLNLSRKLISVDAARTKHLSDAQIKKSIKIAGSFPSYKRQLFKLSEDKLSDIDFLVEYTKSRSEDLWHDLTENQREVLKLVKNKKEVPAGFKNDLLLLVDLGVVREKGEKLELFSIIFDKYIETQIINLSGLSKEEKQERLTFIESLTKNEASLFNILIENIDKITYRDDIIDEIWKSDNNDKYIDWTLDQLTLRLRRKIKKFEQPYEIITIRGRGYKIIKTA